MAGVPKVSPALQALIDKGLFDQLPPTFSTFFFEQIQEWELLFPAERGYHERLFGLLDGAGAAMVEQLFAPLRGVEQTMGVNEKNWPRRHFSLDQVDFLNRSPNYAQWRQAIREIFARLDPLLDAEIERAGHARLVIVTAPAELPVGPDRMWLRIRQHGKSVSIAPPEDVADYLPLLLTGSPRHAAAPSIAELFTRSRHYHPYAAWALAAGPNNAERGVIALSYDRLHDYRVRLMTEVRRIVESGEIRGPRQLMARLKELKMRDSEGSLGADAVLAEFARAVLLSGNGTLLINNTFVEWSAVQAARRARPSVAVISFGIRNKIKPFTGLLIYDDPDTANPIPTQADTLGSYVDLEIFYQYIWQEFEKYAEYRRNTAYVFVGEGMEELFTIAPRDFPLLAAATPLQLAEVFGSMKDWMNI